MPSAVIWEEIHTIAQDAIRRFKLRRCTIEPILSRTRTKDSGVCLRGNHRAIIKIRVHRYHRPKQALKRGYILACLAHELAHLHPQGWLHGPRHREITREIAAWMIEQGHRVCVNMLFHSPFASRRGQTTGAGRRRRR